jgi:stage II sporulation protein AA (anti-sigma F factor antagonist)
MTITVTEHSPGVSIISLAGRFDAEGSGQIIAPFQDALKDNPKLAIVEMSGVDLLASSGIRLLLMGAKTIKAGGGKLVIVGAPTHVQYPMTISGVDTVIPLFNTIEKALARGY